MPNKVKFAYGNLEKVDKVLESGLINAYDNLFLKDENGKPYFGWVDADGTKNIINENLDSDLAAINTKVDEKPSIKQVEEKINSAVEEVINTANAYTDTQIENKITEVASAIEVFEF